MVQIIESQGIMMGFVPGQGQIIESRMAKAENLKVFQVQVNDDRIDAVPGAVYILADKVAEWQKAGGGNTSVTTLALRDYDLPALMRAGHDIAKVFSGATRMGRT